MSFKLNRYTMLNITKAFLLFGFLLLNFAHGKNSATPNVKAVYYLQHHAFINKIHHALSYSKKSVTTNHPFLIQRNPHRTLANHLKMQMFGMPVFFKNRVKNSPAHVKYTFSRDFSVITPKTGSLFSATLDEATPKNAHEKEFSVQMLKNTVPAVGKTEHIDFSVTDSKDATNPKITLICTDSSTADCRLQPSSKGIAQVTITNNLGGPVKVKAIATDGTEKVFTVSFDDQYLFPDSRIIVPEKSANLKNADVTINVAMTTNGANIESRPVKWTLTEDSTTNINTASITATSDTSNTGVATATIANTSGVNVNVVATAPDGTTKDIPIPFSIYNLDEYPYHYPYKVEFATIGEMKPEQTHDLQVMLKDTDGHPVAGKEVTWTLTGNLVNIVKADEADVTPTKTQTVTTDTNGVAKISIHISAVSNDTNSLTFIINFTFDNGNGIIVNTKVAPIKIADCPIFNCNLSCGLPGYKADPVTGCLLCECDDIDSKPILWEQLSRMSEPSH